MEYLEPILKFLEPYMADGVGRYIAIGVAVVVLIVLNRTKKN
jgi:hypothetical protein